MMLVEFLVSGRFSGTHLVGNVHGIAKVVGLDRDEVEYIVGQIAKLTRI